MAVGKTVHMSTSEVAAQCKSLEVSPSCHSATSPIYHGGSRATGHGVSTRATSKMKHGTTRPMPRGTHVEGKKNMMHQKSRGR